MLEFHQKRRKDEKSAPSEYEFHFVDKSGGVKNIFCRVGMIPGTKKSIASLIDITSLRSAQKASQESEERFRESDRKLTHWDQFYPEGQSRLQKS